MGSGDDKVLRPGITLKSLSAILFSMLLMGIAIQYTEVVQSHNAALAEQSVSMPAIVVITVVMTLAGLFTLLSRRRLFSRQELLCILYAMMIATPLMTQGMWHRFFGIIVATPREGNFQYLDALSGKLWPHGPNLLEGEMGEDAVAEDLVSGNVKWEELEADGGERVFAPVLRNSSPEELSSISMVVKVDESGGKALVPGEPCLLSVLMRPVQLGANSSYYIRIYEDGSDTYKEIINDRIESEVTFVHKSGFLRIGKYGVDVPAALRESLRIEIGLKGDGELALWDPQFFSVAAVEGAFRGLRIIRKSEYEKLTPSERYGLIVKPDSMLSLEGLRYLVSGYIPLSAWRETAVAWSAPILLLLAGLFAVSVIMRKQWADSERYPFPLARIPCAIIGEPEEPEDSFWPAVWKSRIAWAGFAVALAWGLLRMWAFYNSKVPDTSIDIPLQPYLSDPGWGDTWKVSFKISALLVSICIFFELNVLLSLVAGFFLYRLLFWVGEFSGLKVYTGYPFRFEQCIGAYIGYAAVVLFFTRRYFWNVLHRSFSRGGGACEPDMPMSSRTAVLLLGAVHIGIVLWAAWLGISVWGVLAYFCFLMLIGFVATKMRCECGLPAGYFTPYNAMLFVSLLGGMTVFGPDGLMLCLIASGFLTVSVFFFIPGMQMEVLEYGRRYRVMPRHTALAVLLGVLGGLFIGGWVFLSNSYALGGESMRYQWAYSQGWYFTSYRTQLAQTTSEFLRAQAGEAVASGLKPETWGFVFGGSVAVVLAVVRQFFAGFWFHPIGFILGPAHMMEWTWGSVLVAWIIRSLVLKFGGAATVRTKLFPFFIGAFAGSVLFAVLNVAYSGVLQSHDIERIFMVLP